jgi:hypothetical protein
MPGIVRLRPLVSHLPIIQATALLSYRTIGAVLAQTGGEPAMPLDDSYIHFRAPSPSFIRSPTHRERIRHRGPPA